MPGGVRDTDGVTFCGVRDTGRVLFPGVRDIGRELFPGVSDTAILFKESPRRLRGVSDTGGVLFRGVSDTAEWTLFRISARKFEKYRNRLRVPLIGPGEVF